MESYGMYTLRNKITYKQLLNRRSNKIINASNKYFKINNKAFRYIVNFILFLLFVSRIKRL